jgi:hypothetical protein
MSWGQLSLDPIELPDGRVLRNLRDAGEFIAALRKATQDLPEWQAATRVLLLVADHDGHALLAYIAIVKAFGAGKPMKPARSAARPSRRTGSSHERNRLDLCPWTEGCRAPRSPEGLR